MINVLHIITGLSTGGAEMMLLKLVSCIDHKRFSSSVVSLMDVGTIGPLIKKLGTPVYPLNMRRGVPSFNALVHLGRIIRKKRPDIIQGWMYHGNYAAMFGKWLSGLRVPVVWNIRGSHIDLSQEKQFTAVIIRLGAYLSKFPACIINNSRKSAGTHSKLLRYPTDRWRVIPNGFETNLFKPSLVSRASVRAELNIPLDALLVGRVGRYHPMKGFETILEAAAIVIRRNTNAHFLLIGEGLSLDNPGLMDIIREKRLDGRIHLLGQRNDIPRLTAACDIACSSSHSEGFPNVIGEAMACGVPCVVTDVGDSAWIVGETGRVVPPGNPEAMANALGELIDMGNDGRWALGALARQRITDNFSLETVVKQYEHLYEDMHLSSARN